MKINLKKYNKQDKGITIIALVITIIVMLILVAVTITMAVNGGLFEYAGRAGAKTNTAVEAEQTLANGRVKIDNTWYDSIEDYIAKKPSTNQEEEEPETPTQTLTLTGEGAVEVKSTIILVAKLNNEEVTASNIQWISSKPDVATVSEGVVTGVNSTKGTTTITATYIPDNTLIATKEITVNAKNLGGCTNCFGSGQLLSLKCPDCGLVYPADAVRYGMYCEGCGEFLTELTGEYCSAADAFHSANVEENFGLVRKSLCL